MTPGVDIAEYAARLPLERLSASALQLYLRCPERFRRRYIELEFEPPSGEMIAGSAVGAASLANYGHRIATGGLMPGEEVLDLFSAEWDLRTEEARDSVGIKWGEQKPGELKDAAARALSLYQRDVVPAVRPLTIERQFSFAFDGMPWYVTGYIDLEARSTPRRKKASALGDLKLKGKRMGQADADSDMQASLYLLARRLEGDPAPRFDFHVLTRTQTPSAAVIPTYRSDAQLDALQAHVFHIAAEIAWRHENELWGYAAPGAWWCAPKWCGFWESCPAGGLHRAPAAPAPELLAVKG